jgi:amidohydrolase family protein
MKAFCVLFTFMLLTFSPYVERAPPASLALTHITVIDMSGAQPKPDMTVLVVGSRIARIGKTSVVQIPRGTQVVDSTGKFLIPGLWDMHVHFTDAKRVFPLFVANGVTGVRNMGGDLDKLLAWRSEVESGKLVGPRIITCGPIIDGPDPAAHGPVVVVATPAEARKTAQSLKRRGVDCLKVYDRLPRDVYFAIIDAARQLGLPVVGHVPLSITSAEASVAGQRSFEHLGTILESASSVEDELHRLERSGEPVTNPADFPRRIAMRGTRMLDTYDEGKANEIFKLLAKNQTWQVPTLETKWAQTFIDDLSRSNDPRLKYVPLPEQEWWRPEKNFFARYRTPEYIEFRKRLFKKELGLVGAMHRARVPLLAGTDLSGAYVFAGSSLHHELEMYVQAGLTPMEALQTATRNAAAFLDELSSQGTIEHGKIANLVLLDANPLSDIRNLAHINAVILNGRFLSRQVLDQMLADAAAGAQR